MTTLALCDSGLSSDEKEELAREILKQPREEVKPGKPKFPVMVWSEPDQVNKIVVVDTFARLAGKNTNDHFKLGSCTVVLDFFLLGLSLSVIGDSTFYLISQRNYRDISNDRCTGFLV